MVGTFLVNGIIARLLIDYGGSHSFIAQKFISAPGIDILR